MLAIVQRRDPTLRDAYLANEFSKELDGNRYAQASDRGACLTFDWHGDRENEPPRDRSWERVREDGLATRKRGDLGRVLRDGSRQRRAERHSGIDQLSPGKIGHHYPRAGAERRLSGFGVKARVIFRPHGIREREREHLSGGREGSKLTLHVVGHLSDVAARSLIRLSALLGYPRPAEGHR